MPHIAAGGKDEYTPFIAGVMKLVNMRDSKSRAARLVGSSPTSGTNTFYKYFSMVGCFQTILLSTEETEMFDKQHWLADFEQTALCEKLLEYGLVKIDNARQLPLKSGGTTDIYINLRDARSNPKAIAFLARRFAGPLGSMRPHRFIEVPDSVSCLAGPLSIETNIPIITVREQEKQGRVTKGKTIGDFRHGESAIIIDDVITDGESKIVPFRVGKQCGLDIPFLFVLVDREQGWEINFKEQNINLRVWSAMTLHRLRRHLVETGAMDRCDPKVEEKNPLIVALDGRTWQQILPIVDELRTMGVIFKVNDLLFEHGFELIRELSVYGRVMADLKLFDITNTVENTLDRLARYNPWAVTIHGSGHTNMVKAAVNTLRGVDTKVLVVTVLTSFNKKMCEEVYHRLPWPQVEALAKMAHEGGADGLVCSPKEVGRLRKLYPDMLLITPGVRSAGEDHGDQKRVSTPAEAIERGANYVVGGRQFLKSKDTPSTEVHRVLTQELGIR